MKGKLYLSFLVAGICSVFHSHSQSMEDSISKDSVEKIITYLASDQLRGRVNYTKEQLEAAEFISGKFSSYGLKPYPGFESFYQPFRTSLSSRSSLVDVKWNGDRLNDSLYYFFSHSLGIPSLDLSDFFILQAYPPVADSILFYNWSRSDNILIQIVLDDTTDFSKAVNNIVVPAGMPASHILIVARNDEASSVRLVPYQALMNSLLYNVVGILPGRSLPDEAIIFSAHYDHVDIGTNGETGGIFNGANDDASGTTAVIELARYFALRKDNERTIIFCLFAGEELGLLGSRAFINYVKPESIKAVINIEMIGITNIAGKDAMMLTGSGYSSLHRILKNNLKDEKVKILEQGADPHLLFTRSDNFTFANKGIPAHTIMSSNDDEPCYHKPCDDVKRIDIGNMTRFIRAIATSATTLISGKDTPTRIKGF